MSELNNSMKSRYKQEFQLRRKILSLLSENLSPKEFIKGICQQSVKSGFFDGCSLTVKANGHTKSITAEHYNKAAEHSNEHIVSDLKHKAFNLGKMSLLPLQNHSSSKENLFSEPAFAVMAADSALSSGAKVLASTTELPP